MSTRPKQAGRGYATFTPKLEEAAKFESLEKALECWQTQSKTRPYREDGKPNRPLTALCMEPQEVT
jgi:hypothetical protein